MLTENYQEHFRRYIRTIGVADMNNARTVIDVFFQNDNMASGFMHEGQKQSVPPNTLDVACALGMDKRIPMEWKSRPDGIRKYGKTDSGISLVADPDEETGLWVATACEADHIIFVKVEGHPCFASAAEHILRLLARKPLPPGNEYEAQ